MSANDPAIVLLGATAPLAAASFSHYCIWKLRDQLLRKPAKHCSKIGG
jgi:hypothetical protein